MRYGVDFSIVLASMRQRSRPLTFVSRNIIFARRFVPQWCDEEFVWHKNRRSLDVGLKVGRGTVYGGFILLWLLKFDSAMS